MIGLEAFAAGLAQGREDAERHVPTLAGSYARILKRAGSTAATRLAEKATLTASDWQPPPEGIIYTGVALPASLVASQKAALLTVVKSALAKAGIVYDPSSAPVRALLAQTQAWTGSLLDETVLPQLQRLIEQAFTDGLAVKDAAALIRETFSEFAPWQGEMLARSTLNMLGNGGSQYAVEQYNARAAKNGERVFRVKRWRTANDAKVRASHRAAEGQTVPVNQPFQVGGSSLMFPGDPAGALAEVLNCRCVLTYEESEANVASAAYTPRMRRRLTAAVAPPVVAWQSDIAFEGAETEDGRFILPGALDWRDLPLTLMAMTVTDDGHDGAFVAGRMDEITKDSRRDMDGKALPSGVTAIRATGIFDTGGDEGANIARLVDDETVRGVSVDLAVREVMLRDPETGEIIDPEQATDEQIEAAMWGDLQLAVSKGTVMAATVCPTPAFANARIAVTASGERITRLWAPLQIVRESLTASAAGLAPLKPPAAWFSRREPDRLTPLTVTDKGEVYGHVAPWNACHTGKQGECFQPPASPSGYAYFNLGEIECKDGTRVPCGQITMGTDHAAISDNWRQAKAHYEDTGTAVADVRASDGLYGIWVSGAVRPHVSAEQVRELRGAKPSGDWRQITLGGPLEMIGALEVNIPGYPVPRPQLQLVASAAFPAGEVVALTAGGLLDDRGLDVSLRVLKARAEGMDGLLALAQS